MTGEIREETPVEAPQVKWLRLKKAAAAVIHSSAIGHLVGWWYRDVIPFHGIPVNVRGAGILPGNKVALLLGMYESAEVRFITAYLRSDLPVVELGSSIGAVSSVIAGHLDNGQRLICVEPNPNLLSVLSDNLSRNASHLDVKTLNAAVAYDAATVSLHLTGDNLTSRRSSQASEQSVEVPAVTLKEVVAGLGGGPYQLVLDIEGGEVAMLLNDATALQACELLVAELHEVRHGGRTYTVADQVDLLQANGFEILSRYGAVVACRRTPGVIL